MALTAASVAQANGFSNTADAMIDLAVQLQLEIATLPESSKLFGQQTNAAKSTASFTYD